MNGGGLAATAAAISLSNTFGGTLNHTAGGQIGGVFRGAETFGGCVVSSDQPFLLLFRN